MNVLKSHIIQKKAAYLGSENLSKLPFSCHFQAEGSRSKRLFTSFIVNIALRFTKSVSEIFQEFVTIQHFSRFPNMVYKMSNYWIAVCFNCKY